MGERGRKPGGGGQGGSPGTRASLPVLSTVCPAGDGKAAAPWPWGWGPQPSPPGALRPLGAPHLIRAGSAAQRPLQVAIKDLLRPPQVFGYLQLDSLTPLLVGVDCGEKGSRGPRQPWEEAGVWAPIAHAMPPTGGQGLFLRLSVDSDPTSVLGSSSGWQTSRGAGGRMVAGETGSRRAPRTTALYRLALTTSWPLSYPGKEWNGVSLSVFYRRKEKPPREHTFCYL